MSASALTEGDFAAALHALLPRGAAWPRDPGTVQAQAVAALAGVVAALHARAVTLLEIEADPGRAAELLADWERAYGLPDPCVGEGATLQERRAALLGRIAAAGGQSRAYFVAVAAAMGFAPVIIEEFRPFRADFGKADDPLNSDPFLWRVRAPTQTQILFRAGVSTAGEPLQRASNLLLECVISRLKPAHTNVEFVYNL